MHLQSLFVTSQRRSRLEAASSDTRTLETTARFSYLRPINHCRPSTFHVASFACRSRFFCKNQCVSHQFPAQHFKVFVKQSYNLKAKPPPTKTRKHGFRCVRRFQGCVMIAWHSYRWRQFHLKSVGTNNDRFRCSLHGLVCEVPSGRSTMW